MPLIISEVAPARITMALSAAPEATSVALNPRASESMATKTPTVRGNAKDRDDRRGPARYYAAKVVDDGIAIQTLQRVHNAPCAWADSRSRPWRSPRESQRPAPAEIDLDRTSVGSNR